MKKPVAKKCSICPVGPPDWQYKCLDCRKKFRMPTPKGPSDEKNRSCPTCKSQNIKHISVAKSEACPPGG